MKIYKLDIDTSKPIRKVVQMQQNSTGALSVDVSNDGKYIRNLSCALYDGDVELSAYATTDVGAGYKIDIGNETKVVKFTAQSTPVECSAQYILSVATGTRLRSVWCDAFQLDIGTYNQDEFYGLANRFGSSEGYFVILIPKTSQTAANINITRITLMPWNTEQPVYFSTENDGGGILPKDEPIVVTGPVVFGRTFQYKGNSATLSSYTYPAIGYYTDYALDTVIRPSENAHCYAEQEVTDPEPEPTPDPEEPVEPTEG